MKLVLWFAVAACTPGSSGIDDSTPARAYLTDRAFRRQALEAELVAPSNGYSQVRLANYAVAGGWDDLPESNPRTEPVMATGEPLALSTVAVPLDLDVDPDDDDAMRALGEQAFLHYPAQLSVGAAQAVSAGAPELGLWRDPARGLGGIHRVDQVDGSVGVAFTCSSCHAAVRGGALVPGVANDKIQVGAMLIAAGAVAPADVAAYDAWGPGRVDVTTLDGREVVRIPDLRSEAHLGFLQADATVRQLDIISLAIRIETLILTSNQPTWRPPRIVTLAIARYLWSLADSLPAIPEGTRGAAVFASTCAGCHVPPALTGAPVALATIGTDPAYGESPQRGTGSYQVPSLHGVSARGLLFHDGSVHSLDVLLDSARLATVPGHTAGLDLDGADRADLLEFLDAL